VRRVLAFLVRNWPLKIAAIGLATLLYAGFVVSRDTNSLPGPIPITALLPEDATVTSTMPNVDQVRYTVVGSDVGPITADHFEAEVDLTNVQRGTPVPVRVRVRPLVGGVIVVGVSPATINVTVEDVITEDVRVDIEVAEPPPDVDLGTLIVTPDMVTIRGARSLVDQVDRVTATVSIEPAALDIDRVLEPFAVDANGDPVTPITVVPRTVHVQLPVINNNESKGGVPIAEVFAGEPAPGYRVAGVEFEPATVTVVGDADDLAALVAIETEPIEITGETATITRVIGLSVPEGLTVPRVDRVTARIRIEVATDNRTYNAALALTGQDRSMTYAFSVPQVTVALFGPVLDLDQVGAAPLLAEVDVSGLGPGSHVLQARPVVPASLTVAASSVTSVTVTITAAAPPSASASGSTSP
jgi:YbbR domain-containing protein